MKRFRLREICTLCGVSRRAVQGYEKYGLVRPCGKTDRGYLLYDEEAAARIREIKFLQNCGFTVSEITGYQSMSPAERTDILSRKHDALIKKRDDINGYIVELETMMKEV